MCKLMIILLAMYIFEIVESTRCPKGWSYYIDTKQCYKFIPGTVQNDGQGHKLCKNVEGELASIHSMEHNEFLYGMVSSATSDEGGHIKTRNRGNLASVIFGARAEKPGQWKNTDNSKYTFQYWYKINESKQYPLCGFMQVFFVANGEIHAEGAGLWRTVPCNRVDWTTPIGALCQRKPT